jgi:hypothetical protein
MAASLPSLLGSRHRMGARFTLSSKALKNRNEFDVFRPSPTDDWYDARIRKIVRSMGYAPEKQTCSMEQPVFLLCHA